jgi:hypothetical protein
MILAVMVLNLGLYIGYKYKIQKENRSEIQMEVNAAVANYFALRGDEPVGANNSEATERQMTNGDF